MNTYQESNLSDFRVSLDLFEGPLDLLLFLVKRAQVSIEEIPISQITEQYLSVLRAARDIDVDEAGDFLVMAATLVEIKARTIAPLSSEEGVEFEKYPVQEEDPKEFLIKQLLMFQRARTASLSLGDLAREAAKRMPVSIFGKGLDEPKFIPIDPEDFHPMDLAEHYERIASAIDFSRLGDHSIEFDETPIELHQEDLLDRLKSRSGKPLPLLETFDGKRSSDRVGLFLATLELVRQRRLWVRQEEIFKDIFIGLRKELSKIDEEQQPLEEKDPSIGQAEDPEVSKGPD